MPEPQTDPRCAVAVLGVSKTYGHRPALREASFQVPAGCLFGLVGVNGAGKTTLLKCLLDACRPDAGEIRVHGLPSRQTQARGQLAFLPERFSAPFYLKGAEFLDLMARLYGHGADPAVRAAVLATLDLEAEALARPVRAYSKGMTQKLGLAACLLSGRTLLVLDEPASGLDPRARARLKSALRTHHREGGTVLLTSHALADVEELCDGLAVLHQGRIRFTGSPAGLCDETGVDSLETAFLRCIGDA